MNIAIVHYHLNRGGVTRVILNHLCALERSAAPGQRHRVALLYGGRREGWSDDLAGQLPSIELNLCPVPLEWVGPETFRSRFAAAYRQVLDWYDQPTPSEAELDADIDSLVVDGMVDFAQLDPTTQRKVLRIVCAEESRREQLHELNPWVGEALSLNWASTAETIHRNAEIVRRRYSLQVSGGRLRDVYEKVLRSPRSRPLHSPSRGDRVLAGFLAVSRFHPLRIES